MKRIIHPSIAEELANISEREEIINGKYLNKESNPYFKEIVKKFHPGELKRAKLLNPGSYIGTVIFNWEKNFFGTPKTAYKIDWLTYLKGIQTTGRAMLKINVDKEILEAIDPCTYYFDGKTEYFITLFEKDDENIKQKYVLLETFYKKVFTRKLFKIAGFDAFSLGDEVSLETLEETKNLKEKLSINLDRLVITRKLGIADLKLIETIIASIDRKIASNEHTILDYGKVWTIIKGMDISGARIDPNDEDSPIDMSKLGNILVTDGPNSEGIQPGVEIVKNTYENIEISLKMIDAQLMQISNITQIPSFAFIGDTKMGNNSGEAKEQASLVFYKKIENYHRVTREIFEEFWEIINATDKERILEFPEIITTSEDEILEIERKRIENQKLLLDSSLTPRVDAIMRIHGVEEAQAKIILKKIEDDNQSKTTETNENTDSRNIQD